MATIYVTKDDSGLIELWDSKPERDDDCGDFVCQRNGDRWPLEDPIIDALVKGLNLRKGQRKRVELTEVKNDGD